MRVIKRKGSLVVAKGKSKTITRHVTFFKRIPSDSDTETLTPSTDLAQKKEPATDVAATPATNVSPPAGSSAETEVIPAEEDKEEIEPEQRQEARPVRARRPPRRFIEEDFE